MAISAKLGAYHPATWGALGWLLTLILSKLNRLPTGVFSAIRKQPILLGLTLFVIWLSYGFHADSLLGGTDEGVYSNQALQIARTGSLSPLHDSGTE